MVPVVALLQASCTRAAVTSVIDAALYPRRVWSGLHVRMQGRDQRHGANFTEERSRSTFGGTARGNECKKRLNNCMGKDFRAS